MKEWGKREKGKKGKGSVPNLPLTVSPLDLFPLVFIRTLKSE